MHKSARKGMPFMGVADSFKGTTPFLKLRLKQAESDLTPREAIAVALANSVSLGIMYFAMFALLFYIIWNSLFLAAVVAVPLAAVMFLMTYFYNIAAYARVVFKRTKDVNKNLLYALQTMQIHISSGMPVFNSIREIASGGYGAVSSEFKLVVDRVNSGSPLEVELEEAALRNPSTGFRQAIWQIVNSIRTGADLNRNLDSIVDGISKEELVEIRRYGAKLNPLVLAYMMLAVIMPSMGVTLLVIISSLPGASGLSEGTFLMLLMGVAVMQVIFIRTIKSKRPDVSVQ
jgi:flagellar protein FlaJ